MDNIPSVSLIFNFFLLLTINMSLSEDALSTKEKLDIVFKKNLGKTTTDVTLPFFSEPALDSRPRVFQNQIFRTEIPTSASDLTFNLSEESNLTSDSNDGTYIDNNSTIPYIRKYIRVKLEIVTPGNLQSYKGPSHGSFNNILANSIPFNYDPTGGYGVTLEYKSGSSFVTIDFGTGEWIIDPDAGTITFFEYDDVSSYINSSSPPYLTFFKYIGNTGTGLEELQNNQILWEQNSDVLTPKSSQSRLYLKSNENNTITSGITFEVDGNVKINGIINASEINVSSDKELKKNIKPIQNPLEKISSLNGVSYEWKKNNRKSYGIIAQDLEKILPHSVSTINDNKIVNYNCIIGLLVESIKDLHLKYNNLYEEYTSLKTLQQ